MKAVSNLKRNVYFRALDQTAARIVAKEVNPPTVCSPPCLLPFYLRTLLGVVFLPGCANIHHNLTQIREMQKILKVIKKEMDPKAYEEMRMALMGWAHTKNYMKAVFDAWKAAVESLNDEEQGQGDDDAGNKNSRSIMQTGFGLIFLGTMVIMAFADPLVNTIGRFGKNINVSPFLLV